MSAHTPGPWAAECNQHADTVYAGNMRICDIRGWGHLIGSGGLGLDPEKASAVQGANAKLIAAAPDLLAALKDVLEYYGESEYMPQARAAIAKAEGAA